MPAYHRIYLDGGYTANPETFSVSFATTASSTPTPSADLSAWAEAIRTTLAGASAGTDVVKSWLSTAGEVRRVRAYWYPDVNSAAGQFGTSFGVPVAGSTTVRLPPQCAMVVSLLTGLPGARNRGRMYWPAVGVQVGSNGKASGITQTQVTNLATFLDAIATPTSPVLNTQLAVVSAVAGTVTPVTSIRVGDVVDTQRRRRDALVETYLNGLLP